MRRAQRREGIKHFFRYGRFEDSRRDTWRLPNHFDVHTYRAANKDVDDFVISLHPNDMVGQNIAAAKHFIQNGSRENRTFGNLPSDFNPYTYLRINSDVKRAAEEQYPGSEDHQYFFAKRHYLRYGLSEAGRRYK